jgi:chemotaxis protein methyltransferase CheR
MTDAILNHIKNLISAQTGLSLREQEEEPLRDIVRGRMSALKLSSLEEYYELLSTGENSRREQEQLAILLTTGETYFFRDSGQFTLLKDKILPELIELRKSVCTLRIWSAACSSGEEAYSLAMLLDELLNDQSRWSIMILGSDVNDLALDKARHGAYSEWSFRATDDARRQCYFQRHGNAWVLDRRIRDRVTFRNVNMLADTFPNAASELIEMDLILCRNLFIYMLPGMVSRVTDKLTETLAEGGYLLTGHGELYAHHLGKLRTRIFPESIVYQKVSDPISPPFFPFQPACLPPRASGNLIPDAKTEKVTPPPIAPEEPVAAKETGIACKDAGSDAMQQAWTYANQGQPEKAASCCREMIAANPLDAEPYYLSALLAQERGDTGEAKVLLKKTIYLLPTFAAAYLELGDLYERENNGVQAIKMRTTALGLLKDLPPDLPVKLYGDSTAQEILEYVQQLIKLPDNTS